jgi:hypothetical protein
LKVQQISEAPDYFHVMSSTGPGRRPPRCNTEPTV